LHDFGGHTEYFAALSLFSASLNPTVLVCYDSTKVASTEEADMKYHNIIGSYINLVQSHCLRNGGEPKLIVVATKVDTLDEYARKRHIFQHILDRCKVHVSEIGKHLKGKGKIFLLDEVLATTSNENISQLDLRKMSSIIDAINVEEELQDDKQGNIPTDWFNFLDAIRYKLVISTTEALQKFIKQYQMKSEINNKSLTENQISTFYTFKRVLESNQVYHHVSMGEGEREEYDNIEPEIDPEHVTEQTTMKEKKMKEKGKIRKRGLGKIKKKENDVDDDEIIEETYHTKSSVMELVLDFMANIGEVMVFKNDSLKEKIVTVPQNFIECLRWIINHKCLDAFIDVEDRYAKDNLKTKGYLKYNDFLKIVDHFKMDTQDLHLSNEEIWDFIINFGLAKNVKTEDANNPAMFIPCLIGDNMRKEMKQVIEDVNLNPEALCLQYSFNKTWESLGAYQEVVSFLHSHFFLKGDGCQGAFSQKIENRTIGLTNALHGKVKWTEKDMKDPGFYHIVIEEHEINVQDSGKPATHVVIKVSAEKEKEKIDENDFKYLCEIVLKIDRMMTEKFGSITKEISCRECIQNLVDKKEEFSKEERDQMIMSSFFELENNAGISTVRVCKNRKHNPSPWLLTGLNDARHYRPFSLKKILDKPKEKLGLQHLLTLTYTR